MNSTTLGFSINPNFLSRPQTSSNGIMGQLNENLEGNRPKTTMEKKRGDTIKIGDLMGRTINNVEEQNMIIRQEIRSKFGSSQQRPLTVKSNFINSYSTESCVNSASAIS